MTRKGSETGATLIGEGIALTMVADGGRITSLFDLERQREWLEPPGAMDPARAFDDGEMGGWDEMMPTIAPCRHPRLDIELPDHGELWRRPWRLGQISDGAVTAEIDGDVLDYHFSRTISLAPRSARFDYVLTSSSPELLYLWAAHPLFAVAAGTRLDVPGLVLGRGHVSLPVDLVADVPLGHSAKYFVAPSGPTASASLIDPDGASLTLRWSRTETPYVGVWLDHAAYARHPVVGVEPTNATDDSLARAVARGGLEALAGERRWSIEVHLGHTPTKEEHP